MDKGKVTAKVNLSNVITVQPRPPSRPQSPFKAKQPQSASSRLVEPTFRPKAKVSSSAAIVVGRSSSSSTVSSTVKSTPRPTSPFKQSPGHQRELSSIRSTVDAHSFKSRASLTAHGLARQRSLTSTDEASSGRERRGSGSFQPVPHITPTPRLSPDSSSSVSPSQVIRVKAKVSSLAKSNGSSAPPTPTSSLHSSSPPYATAHPIENRPRAPSIIDFTGFISSPPSPTLSTVPITIHPITTPTSAANPHRYLSRNPTSTHFRPLSRPGSRDLDNDVHFRVAPNVDPAAIPLPPQSPPASTLSSSSQSSQNTQSSSVSGSTAPTPSSHIHSTAIITGERGSPALGPSSTLDTFSDVCDSNSPRHSLGSPAAHTDQSRNSDRKIRAEAKSNRKIEDLEITNRSLLAINATLEASKHKQANEIRELRRKLRESRLVLPPRAFRAIKSSLGPEDVADDEDIEDDDNENDNDEDGDEHDEIYGRVKHILEDLLEMGRRALRAEPGDFGKQGSSVKVLSAEEVRSWRGDMGDDVSSMHSTHTDAESDGETGLQRQPPTPSQITIPGDDESRPEGEGEGEAMMDGGEHNAGILPPITVTFS